MSDKQYIKRSFLSLSPSEYNSTEYSLKSVELYNVEKELVLSKVKKNQEVLDVKFDINQRIFDFLVSRLRIKIKLKKSDVLLDFDTYKDTDEWFRVRLKYYYFRDNLGNIDLMTECYYKCDQVEGLVACINWVIGGLCQRKIIKEDVYMSLKQM